MPHYGSPGQAAGQLRLQTLEPGGPDAAVPFTYGHPDRYWRNPAASASSPCWPCASQHQRHGHLQEVIVQNFRAKPGTQNGGHAPEPDLEDLLWTIADRRACCSGPEMNIQAPPKPQPGGAAAAGRGGHQRLGRGVAANPGLTSTPRRPGHTSTALPTRQPLQRAKYLEQRLTIYPALCPARRSRWLDPALHGAVPAPGIWTAAVSPAATTWALWREEATGTRRWRQSPAAEQASANWRLVSADPGAHPGHLSSPARRRLTEADIARLCLKPVATEFSHVVRSKPMPLASSSAGWRQR